ncbi:MAG: 50S ribosomal protein L24 [Chloroflexi bacterium]|nr:50S ribosomal protein L24 [Chloroflexota bacterium]
MAARVKRNDTVEVITGKDRGRRGSVRQVLRKRDRVIVTGINMVKKHRRSQNPTTPSDIIDLEAPLHLSNVMLVCPSCDAATRVGFRELDSGGKTRFCKRCGNAID